MESEKESENIPRQDSKSDLLIIGMNEGASLQNSFMKFRDQKIKERQIMKLCQNAAQSGGRSESFKESLRMKFIEAAKRYIGVPYAQRYKEESDPIAPLYLDCCALVRQAVQDLQEDFGFVIGRWNQAYQMDTLPIVLKEEDLKPGDLIFYEGLYNSKRSKPQKHNNVHVEIFLGGETGKATIGSRYHRGKVSIFPSYEFKSTTWDLVQYHFRSLDTWLDGICRSHCAEHPWHNEALAYVEAAGKRSIFCDDCQDIGAGGDDEDDDNGGEPVPNEVKVELKEIKVEQNDEQQTHEEQEGDQQESSANNNGSVNQYEDVVELKKSDEVVLVSSQSDKNLNTASGAGDDDNKKSKTSTATTSSKNNNNTTSTKKPKRVSSLVNKSQDNSNTETGNNNNTSNSIKGVLSVSAKIPREREVSKSMTSIDQKSSSKSAKETTSVNKSYYVGKTNGWKLVKAALDKRGWTQLPFEYQFSTRFGLKWVERRSDIDYRTHVAGQLVCHIPNNDVITTKIGLLTALKDKFCKQPIGSNVKLHPPWLPETYDLDSPADSLALLQAAEAIMKANQVKAEDDLKKDNVTTTDNTNVGAETTANNASSNNTGIWIYKPSCYNRGRGIKVVSGLDTLKEICHGKQTGDPETTIAPLKGIVQKYITNPLLVGPAGYKFDIRCYMLIARNYPTTLAFYHPGYCRLALKPYTLETLSDVSVHLTNASVQKKDPIYDNNKEFQIQSVAAIATNMDEHGKPDSAEYIRNQLDHEIMCCMCDVLRASNHVLMRKHGFFDLLGCDFMLTSDNKLQLLEINTNPALSLDNSTLENLLPGVVDGALEIILAAQGPERLQTDNADELLLSSLPQQYKLIYNESNGYFYK